MYVMVFLFSVSVFDDFTVKQLTECICTVQY